MEFDDIRAFVAVAEARSVSRAARELYLTQPAVTRRVQRLERALGVALCDRRRRPFALTEAGQAVLERCRRVLHAVRDIRSASDGDALAAREIRIGVAHALTEVTLTEPVDRVRRAFPRVSLCLSTGWSRDLLERVRARALDGAIVLLPDSERLPAGLAATRLGQENLVVVGLHLISADAAGQEKREGEAKDSPTVSERRARHVRALLPIWLRLAPPGAPEALDQRTVESAEDGLEVRGGAPPHRPDRQREIETGDAAHA